MVVLLLFLLITNAIFVEANILLDVEFNVLPNEKESRQFEVIEPVSLTLEIRILEGHPTIDRIVIYDFDPSDPIDPREILEGGVNESYELDEFYRENVGNETFNLEIDEIGFYKIQVLSSAISKVKIVITTDEGSESKSADLQFSSVIIIGSSLLAIFILKQSNY